MEVEQYKTKKQIDMQKKYTSEEANKNLPPRSGTITFSWSSTDLCDWNLKKLDGIVKLKSFEA